MRYYADLVIRDAQFEKFGLAVIGVNDQFVKLTKSIQPTSHLDVRNARAMVELRIMDGSNAGNSVRQAPNESCIKTWNDKPLEMDDVGNISFETSQQCCAIPGVLERLDWPREGAQGLSQLLRVPIIVWVEFESTVGRCFSISGRSSKKGYVRTSSGKCTAEQVVIWNCKIGRVDDRDFHLTTFLAARQRLM